MSQRYKKSVTAVMTTEPEISSGYSTRNKRRRLNELETPPPILRHTKSPDTTQPHQVPQRAMEAVQPRTVPTHGRNLDKALKSILSENPRIRSSRAVVEKNDESKDVSPSADDEASPSAVIVMHENGHTSSVSRSSQSRETTPSSNLGGQIVHIAPFIEFFQKERQAGKVSKEVRDEAYKMLREWHSEWLTEDKRIRELKRKIKSCNSSQVDVLSTSTTEVKSRARQSAIHLPVEEAVKSVESPEADTSAEPESTQTRESRASPGTRKESVTGPNGLTGSYWDISIDEMGRGNRRKARA